MIEAGLRLAYEEIHRGSSDSARWWTGRSIRRNRAESILFRENCVCLRRQVRPARGVVRPHPHRCRRHHVRRRRDRSGDDGRPRDVKLRVAGDWTAWIPGTAAMTGGVVSVKELAIREAMVGPGTALDFRTMELAKLEDLEITSCAQRRARALLP